MVTALSLCALHFRYLVFLMFNCNPFFIRRFFQLTIGIYRSWPVPSARSTSPAYTAPILFICLSVANFLCYPLIFVSFPFSNVFFLWFTISIFSSHLLLFQQFSSLLPSLFHFFLSQFFKSITDMLTHFNGRLNRENGVDFLVWITSIKTQYTKLCNGDIKRATSFIYWKIKN